MLCSLQARRREPVYASCGRLRSTLTIHYYRPALETDKTERGTGSIRTDRGGKVFAVLSKGMRLCLICEGAFTRQASREHAEVSCRPAVPQVGDSLQYPICESYVPQA
jgi:hypothetical protein